MWSIVSQMFICPWGAVDSRAILLLRFGISGLISSRSNNNPTTGSFRFFVAHGNGVQA